MSPAKPGHDGSPNGIDLDAYPTAQKLAARSLEFLQEIQNLYSPPLHLPLSLLIPLINLPAPPAKPSKSA